MNASKNEIQKKININEFAEKIMGIKLYPFQRELLQHYLEKGKILIFGRRHGRKTLELIIREYEQKVINGE